MVTKVDDEARHQDLPDLQDEFDTEVKNLERRRDNEIEVCSPNRPSFSGLRVR